MRHFNRTIIELKPTGLLKHSFCPDDFNRTIIELKLRQVLMLSSLIRYFNRTIIELKRVYEFADGSQVVVILIAL